MFRERTDPFDKIVGIAGRIFAGVVVFIVIIRLLTGGFGVLERGASPETVKDLEEMKESGERGIRIINSPSDLALFVPLLIVIVILLNRLLRPPPRYGEP